MSDLKLPSLSYVTGLIKLCKAQGVQRVKLGVVELDFAPPADPGPDGEGMRALAEALGRGTMGDEEALFASAPQFRTAEQIEAMTKAMTGQG
jgi:hypothetical protein